VIKNKTVFESSFFSSIEFIISFELEEALSNRKMSTPGNKRGVFRLEIKEFRLIIVVWRIKLKKKNSYQFFETSYFVGQRIHARIVYANPSKALHFGQ